MASLEKLKRKIKEKNMSYSLLSEEIGISLSALNNKLNGRSTFDIIEASKLLSILDISPEDIAYFFT
ncbi:MAG: helix-turn-helix transcriptional regulator [Eubacterium sp.]|nr:helix-turn-helix transcriptional regulator [Eubacterium sp.]